MKIRLGLALVATLLISSTACAEPSKVSLDGFDAKLPSATAAIQQGGVGASQITVYFFSFPFTEMDQQLIATGRTKQIVQRHLLEGTESDFAYAQLVLSVDDKFNILQADLATQPSTLEKLAGCTVAQGPSAKGFASDYKFDGQTLTLKTTGAFDCVFPSRTAKLSWNIALENLAVVKKP